MKKVYRTSHGEIETESIERTDGERTDGYVLTAEDEVPLFPGFPSFAEHMRRRAKERRDALLRRMDVLTDQVELMLAKAKRNSLLRQRAASDKRDAKEAARVKRVAALKAKVLADQDAKWGP